MNDTHPLSGAARDNPLSGRTLNEQPTESNRSAVSWGAIIAGAAAAAALSLILLILGTGLGLTAVSPWATQGASATTLGVSAIVWLAFTQLAASGMGGYLAGRLRTKWVGTHTDEVYFRDTAHGFLAWAVATLATAALLTSAIGAIVGSGVQAGAALTAGAGSAATAAGATALGGAAKSASSGQRGEPEVAYFVDSMFRTDTSGGTAGSATPLPSATPSAAPGASAPSPNASEGSTAAASAEAVRIFANALRSGTLAADDAHYLGQVVAQRTGLPQADAQKRVTDTYNRMAAKAKDAETAAREAADKARHASAYASLWLFIALLIGAFVASLAATYGGRRRDL